MAKQPTPNRPDMKNFPILALGASAGGLEAFETFFKAMSHDSGLAFVLIAHLDPSHASLLPELLQKRSKMKVRQIQDGMKVEANHVYVIPPNKELTINNGVLQLMELTQPRGSNLAIDAFFQALAKDQGSNAIAIVLSGTGTDGTLGLKAIKGETGMVMAQDEQSAKYDGMPRSAIATGLVDYVLPPNEMPAQLLKYIEHAWQKNRPSLCVDDKVTPDALQKIYIILRTQTDHDFSLYKKNTICRRIERRMNVHQIDDIEDYARYLQDNEREINILFKELLIGVTNFFRDFEAFEALRKDYLYNMLKEKPQDYTIRVWVTGCSSGEEAYSLAIILQECMLALKRHFNVQIFATDIDEEAINVARAGVYPQSIHADVSSQRLKRYFTKEDDGRYRIKKAIREMLVFAPQNVIKDPPFTKLDILSCRNLLIYFGPELQKKLFPIFNYSLNPDGILFLGSSETIGQAVDMFSVLDKKWKIFHRQYTGMSFHPVLDFPTSPTSMIQHQLPTPALISKELELSTLQLTDTILQHSNTPPCVIIDDACNVVYIHGRTGRFLEPAEGKISVNVLEMARPGLKPSLSTAIRKVAMHKQEIVLRDLQLDYHDEPLLLDLTVKPVLEQSAMRGLMMVMFEEKTRPSKSGKDKQQAIIKRPKGKSAEDLEWELQYAKEHLQTTIEELETSNEELKSTNEELQSTNEELQSTNEEMETSKEELQSLNEESSTVNAELQSRIDELSQTNDDMKNLLDSTDIATLFLDVDLCIRRFTPKTTEIIPLSVTDSGRPITHFATSLVDIDLSEYSNKVLHDLVVQEIEVQSKDGNQYVMKVRPYRTVNNLIDGVVITFEDVTERKQAEHLLMKAERDKVAWLEHSSVCTKIVDLNYNLRYMSRSGIDALGIADIEPFYNQPYPFEFYPQSFKTQMIANLDKVKETGTVVTQEEATVDINNNEMWYFSTLVPVNNPQGQLDHIIVVSMDVTERKQAQDALIQSEARYQMLFETALADDSIVLVDATTLSIKEGNQQAYQHLGYSRQQFLQLKLTDIQTSQSANDLVANLVDVQSSQQYAEFDSQHRSKNGDIHHVQVKARNIDVSEKRLVLCTWRDIQPMINADKQ